jgi:hypothetical protein
MKRRVTVKESGNGFILTLEVQDDGGEKVFEKEMLVVGADMASIGEAVVELFKTRIRDRRKKKVVE